MTTVQTQYSPFPDRTNRNWLQEYVEIPLMLGALSLPRRACVLEVGCGRGNALPALARRLAPSRLVGADIDVTLLATAGMRMERSTTQAELVAADMRDLPFPDGTFDIVIDFGTCYHIARPEDALREITRVLKPRGVFVTETRLSQLLAHPIRSRKRSLPWSSAPAIVAARHALLWQSRERCARQTP
jgi:ubiquinone/menaquinone biosynthesis C-methylase UbiE